MKKDKLSKKTESELKKELENKRERLRVLGFDLAAKRVKNVREIRKVKRDIARTLTILCQKSNNK